MTDDLFTRIEARVASQSDTFHLNLEILAENQVRGGIDLDEPWVNTVQRLVGEQARYFLMDAVSIGNEDGSIHHFVDPRDPPPGHDGLFTVFSAGDYALRFITNRDLVDLGEPAGAPRPNFEALDTVLDLAKSRLGRYFDERLHDGSSTSSPDPDEAHRRINEIGDRLFCAWERLAQSALEIENIDSLPSEAERGERVSSLIDSLCSTALSFEQCRIAVDAPSMRTGCREAEAHIDSWSPGDIDFDVNPAAHAAFTVLAREYERDRDFTVDCEF